MLSLDGPILLVLVMVDYEHRERSDHFVLYDYE